jgi:hypothetical protein
MRHVLLVAALCASLSSVAWASGLQGEALIRTAHGTRVIAAPDGDSVALAGFMLGPLQVYPPEWHVSPPLDSADATLIFVTAGERDTLYVCKRVAAAPVRSRGTHLTVSVCELTSRHHVWRTLALNGRIVRDDTRHGLVVRVHGAGGVLGGVLSGRYNAIDQRKGLL